ncbi:MAG: hypothetical protein U0P48_07885 [Ancrocorticia sp.]
MRVIPGPTSVAGVIAVDEPIAQILARYEVATVARIEGEAPEIFSPRHRSRCTAAFVPYVMWHGNLAADPANLVPETEIVESEDGLDLIVPLDTVGAANPYAVTELRVPLILPESVANGGLPIVDDSRLPDAMNALLSAMAGVGAPTIGGTPIESLPTFAEGDDEAHFTFAVSPAVGAACGRHLAKGYTATAVPRRTARLLLATIYAALARAASTACGRPGLLLNAVHLNPPGCTLIGRMSTAN